MTVWGDGCMSVKKLYKTVVTFAALGGHVEC